MLQVDNYFNEIVLLWMSRYDYYESWKLKHHKHNNFYQIIYVIQGSAVAYVEGHIFNMKTNTMLFIAPNCDHAIDSVGKHGLKTYDIKFTINNSSLERKIMKIPLFSNNLPEYFLDLLGNVYEEAESKDYEYQKLCQLLLGQFLILLIRFQLPIMENSNKIEKQLFTTENISMLVTKILAFVQNNFQKKITESDFEQACNYSYRYLSIQTQKELNLSPKKILNHYRIYIAQRKLVLSISSIKEIADEIGFSSIHEFSRCFKNLVGVPPSQYRKESKSKVWKDIYFDKNFNNVNYTEK